MKNYLVPFVLLNVERGFKTTFFVMEITKKLGSPEEAQQFALEQLTEKNKEIIEDDDIPSFLKGEAYFPIVIGLVDIEDPKSGFYIGPAQSKEEKEAFDKLAKLDLLTISEN